MFFSFFRRDSGRSNDIWTAEPYGLDRDFPADRCGNARSVVFASGDPTAFCGPASFMQLTDHSVGCALTKGNSAQRKMDCGLGPWCRGTRRSAHANAGGLEM